MTSDAPRVRLAIPADADGIARVHVRSWRETYAGIVPEHLMNAAAEEERRRMWAAILGLGPVPGVVAVAERDGQVVGFAFAGSSAHPDAVKGVAPSRPVHLFSLYLLAAEHGAGLGRELLAAVIGDDPAQLWLADSNTRAKAFYERQGFRADGAEVDDPEIADLREIRMVR
ncbi:GNAT family N-acetyltransferase [Streptomyces sp. AC495_CC817]|uniref:GNAT family N-acetyltransferase n=1 Tax=Streptomyces sp. AC495_CC817 TaxID=2823900 RepID=UPI001C27347F|nr:GNAT family N-acetyltransferase [Streptomyces sp. AC495_CC817]